MKKSIGIFDSGLGGLTVLKDLADHFPEESFCYLGDIARLPYGNKSPETIRRYGIQILEFLEKQNVKALIIACNSASTVFLDETFFKSLPLLNVIGPGAEAALEKCSDHKIGILGTSATVKSHAYKNTLLKINPDVRVFEKACPLLVPLAEEGFIDDSITRMILERYLQEIKSHQVKTVILGCTHYPILRSDLMAVLGEGINLVESGQVLSQKLDSLFREGVIEASQDKDRTIRVCITDITEHFEQLATKLMKPYKFTLEKVIL